MMAVVLFVDHCKRPCKNSFYFFFQKKKSQNVNLTFSKYVILLSRHVNSQVAFYFVIGGYTRDRR